MGQNVQKYWRNTHLKVILVWMFFQLIWAVVCIAVCCTLGKTLSYAYETTYDEKYVHTNVTNQRR